MKATVFAAHKLPLQFDDRWRKLQQLNPALRSPFFRPEFIRAVARLRNDVFVGVIDDGEAFFAFQRNALGIGRAVGGLMSDYDGLVASPGYSCDAKQLVRRCGLNAWSFLNTPAAQAQFEDWRCTAAESWIIDLTRGSVGSSHLNSNVNQSRRKLERVVGAVRLEIDVRDSRQLKRLIAWKSAQYRRLRSYDQFSAEPWTCKLLHELHARREGAGFTGMLSTLRAGNRVIAAHFGVRSGDVLHYWFPSYDVQFGNYSPGLMLLKAVADAGPDYGLSSIDLGKGTASFKQRFATGSLPLLEGSVWAVPWVAPLQRFRERLAGSPAAQPIRSMKRTFRHISFNP